MHQPLPPYTFTSARHQHMTLIPTRYIHHHPDSTPSPPSNPLCPHICGRHRMHRQLHRTGWFGGGGSPNTWTSKKIIAVANDSIRKSQHITLLPYNLPSTLQEADTPPVFRWYLVGIKPFSDFRCVSIFHAHEVGVTIHNRNDVKIEFLALPLVYGTRDRAGLWTIPLTNQRQEARDIRYPLNRPRHLAHPTHHANHAHTKLNSKQGGEWIANNVYELPSIAQGIKWMHAVCGYPLKSTWMKSIRSGNYAGWPLLAIKHVHCHYPDTTEIPQAHLNQTRKNFWSTKPKPMLLPTIYAKNLQEKWHAMCTSKCTKQKIPRTPTRPDVSPSIRNGDTSTSCWFVNRQ